MMEILVIKLKSVMILIALRMVSVRNVLLMKIIIVKQVKFFSQPDIFMIWLKQISINIKYSILLLLPLISINPLSMF